MPANQLPSEDEVRAERQKTSDRFSQFVTVVFGLVIGQGFTRYIPLVLDPSVSWFQFSALAGVYTTTILSWITYIRSMYKYPYDMTRWKSWLRMGMDFAAVSTYARLLFSLEKIAPGVASPNLTIYLQGYLLIFVFYILSGLIRRWEYNDVKASKLRGLFVSALFYALLLIGYGMLDSQAALNAGWFFMLACPIYNVLYRIWRQWHYSPMSA